MAQGEIRGWVIQAIWIRGWVFQAHAYIPLFTLFLMPGTPSPLFFCQAKTNPLIFQVSSLLWRFLWLTPPLFLLLGRSTINHPLWIPIELLRPFYGSAYLIFFEGGAWVRIYLLYLSPAPTLTQSQASVGIQWLAWNKWMNKEMGCRLTGLDREKMRFKKMILSREREVKW